jgi:hypothetical protein
MFWGWKETISLKEPRCTVLVVVSLLTKKRLEYCAVHTKSTRNCKIQWPPDPDLLEFFIEDVVHEI